MYNDKNTFYILDVVLTFIDTVLYNVDAEHIGTIPHPSGEWWPTCNGHIGTIPYPSGEWWPTCTAPPVVVI